MKANQRSEKLLLIGSEVQLYLLYSKCSSLKQKLLVFKSKDFLKESLLRYFHIFSKHSIYTKKNEEIH